MALTKLVDGKRVPVSREDEAAIRAEWQRPAVPEDDLAREVREFGENPSNARLVALLARDDFGKLSTTAAIKVMRLGIIQALRGMR